MSEKENVPACVGFIMDGNRRWAKAHALDSLLGHKKGKEAFHTIVRCLRDRSIAHGVFYAFSTENWNRPKREVSYLMELLQYEMQDLLKGMAEEKVRIRIIGERERLPTKLQSLISELEEKSSEYLKTTIWIALSYGGRAEILNAVKRTIEAGKELTEEAFSNFLWTSEMPDPDLIVRTGGEKRLSNFLSWQSVYSELFFLDTYWPDFGEAEFQSILEEYATRERRRGK